MTVRDLLISWSFCFLTGCGKDPQVIDRRKDVLSSDLGNQKSDDLIKRTAEEEAFITKIDTPVVLACKESGMIFDRRNAVCSKEFKVGDFPCNRKGIQTKFVDTGFQIVSVLDQALGKPENPTDRGEGFLVDQCGMDGTGRILIILVKPTVDGRITVREIM